MNNKKELYHFNKEYKLLKEIPRQKTFCKVGDNYPEFLYISTNKSNVEYVIIDDNFGMPSPANTMDTPYAIKLRKRSFKILKELENEGYIQLKK